jgi:excisionase family DNA binding protein
MTGALSKIHDVGIEPVPTVAETTVAAAKWRERAERVEIAKRERAAGHFAHEIVSIVATDAGRDDLALTFYSVNEVAKRLDVCSKTIRNWIRDGRLPAHRLGKKLGISKSDFDGFVARCRTPDG